MRELVEYVIKSLIKDDEEPIITITEEEKKVNITVLLKSKNYGRVIGKNGKTASAIRTLLKSCSPRFYGNKKLYVDIGE